LIGSIPQHRGSEKDRRKKLPIVLLSRGRCWGEGGGECFSKSPSVSIQKEHIAVEIRNTYTQKIFRKEKIDGPGRNALFRRTGEIRIKKKVRG